MKKIKILITVFALVALFTPASLHAQQPNFQSPENISRLCEQFNAKRKNKDCACVVKKYKTKETEIFKQRNNGTVPPHDSVFRLIDHECNILTSEAEAALGVCMKSPPVNGLTASQVDIFCKCQAASLTRMGAMFEHVPNATSDMKKQMKDQVLLSSKHACKERATSNYR